MLEIIKSNLELTSDLRETSAEAILASLAIATACGIIIYLVYRFFFRGIVYSENFNLLIMLTCVVTSFIIKTISVNLVLSLGMVGALSIVRFRAAVKDPLDVGFLFWAVAAGLTSGAQLYGIALIGTIFIAILYILMNFVRRTKQTFLLIIRFDPSSEEAVNEELKKIKYKLKNKTKTPQLTEITAEVNVKGNNASLLDSFNAIPNMHNCVLLEYSGDYAN